jgi:hypothetical protein
MAVNILTYPRRWRSPADLFATPAPALPRQREKGPVDRKGIGWRPVLLGSVLCLAILLSHESVIGVAAFDR